MNIRVNGRARRRLVGALVAAVLVAVLVVAGAVGLAVASSARTVTITEVDGADRPTSTAVQSDAERVADVLAEAGVIAGAQDVVEPGLDRPVGDDDAIRITRARDVDVTIDGRPRHLTTPLRTVGQLLGSLGLPAGTRAAVPADRDLASVPRPLVIATPKNVSISVDGRTRTVRTAAPTVRQAITEQGIRIGRQDQVAPDAASVPTTRLRITVTRIGTGATVTERESVPCSTEVRQDPARRNDETVVLREGEPGEIVRTYAARTVDGQPRGRVLVGTVTVRQPVSRIVAVGTLDRPGQDATPFGRLTPPGPTGPAGAPADPSTGSPDPTRSDPTRSDSTRSDSTRSDSTRSDSTRSDPTRPVEPAPPAPSAPSSTAPPSAVPPADPGTDPSAVDRPVPRPASGRDQAGAAASLR
ncbi:hypothetical protein GCM10011512_19930 [Tersicoccus solisilvae]|uniref:G5 domain-containing protein n=1 Tax=Tersicoccus solisilvae TaxID=1882339 RepID=A0ABQ1P9Q4_9MICC|nr:ubiquitin-like domain-containing protein [Tersicoccus solisilvae]GGC92879.1 hypothetical protein GCM10011512_19930 [Tersicoccus solisilvae]